MTLPAVTPEERRNMWLNFLYHCKPGTVVAAADTVVWQKRSPSCWVRTGSSHEYDPVSIASPVSVLLDGVE